MCLINLLIQRMIFQVKQVDNKGIQYMFGYMHMQEIRVQIGVVTDVVDNR